MSDDRTAAITGLCKLADLLAANPEVPVYLPQIILKKFPERGTDA